MTQVYNFDMKSANSSDRWIWKCKSRRKLSQNQFFLEAEIILYHLFWEHKIYKERPTRFEGKSSKNLKEKFMFSIKDVIWIIMSNMILGLTPRGRLFYCQSRRYTILKSFYIYHHRRRFVYPESTKKMTMLLDWSTIFI